MYLSKLSILLFFLTAIFILFYTQQALAVTVSVINAPSIITEDNFTVTASISGAQSGSNYLRVDIFKDGSTNYFGETYNGSSWYNGSDGTKYIPITIQSSTIWNGSIQGRVGSPSMTQFDGTGTYKLRIRRYTSSGNVGSSDVINSVIVAIAISTPTPTPTNKPLSAQVSTVTPTSKPTSTPTLTNKPSSTPVYKLTPVNTPTFSKPNPSQISSPNEISTFGAVLGTASAIHAVTEVSPTSFSASGVKIIQTNNKQIIFIIIGFCLLCSCGILIALQTEKGKDLWKRLF